MCILRIFAVHVDTFVYRRGNGGKGIEGEYQAAINRMGRATLGTYKSTPLGMVAAESGLVPARALLNHRQSRFAQRLYARPKDGEGPEEILEREAGTALTARLRAAASLQPGNTVERQEWSRRLIFPGEIAIDSRAKAFEIASRPDGGTWTREDTIWTDGSRLDSGKVGAVCAWETPSGWTGRRFHLGTNKEVFDAEVYAIYQALRNLDQRQERDHRYTIFVDSTAAIDRIQSDLPGPGQHFAAAAIEACTGILSRSNTVVVRWVPAHHNVPNKIANRYAKAAAEGTVPDSTVADRLRWETSLSHMTQVSTEEWSHTAAQWVAERLGDPRRKYKPLSRRGLRRKLLWRVPKSIASRYYQLLSGHAAIGPYLKDKIHKIDDRCWRCGGGKQQTRHHLFTECRAWMPQIGRLWKDIGKAQGWKHPRAPSGKSEDRTIFYAKNSLFHT